MPRAANPALLIAGCIMALVQAWPGPAHSAPPAKKKAPKAAAHSPPKAAAHNPPKATAAQNPPASPVGAAAGKAPSSALDLSGGNGPMEITSDDGIEMQQADKVYIARGNVVAKRGDRTLYGDTVNAYYREVPNSSDTEIWRIVADGHVRITTPTQSVEGDHGVYDLDTKTAVVTGGHLKLTTPQDLITAKDSLEWYDDKQLGVARGNAVGIRADRQIRGDVLTAQVVTAPGQAARISRIDANGHVVASRPDEVGTADKGIYNVDRGLVTLSGHVTLAQGASTLRGQYGVMDLQTGVSRVLPQPPGVSGENSGRVQGYIVPKKRDQTKPAGEGSARPSAPGSEASAGVSPEKARTASANPR